MALDREPHFCDHRSLLRSAIGLEEEISKIIFIKRYVDIIDKGYNY